MPRKFWSIFSMAAILITTIVALGAFYFGGKPATAESPPAFPSISLSKYHIVYLVKEGAVERNSLMAPSRLEDANILGVQVAHSWDKVLTLDRAAPVDALIIHNSAISLVDQDWVSNAYRQGIVIATFNIYAPELANLVEDPCIAKDNFASESYSVPFYVSIARLTMGQPEDVALIERDQTCGEEAVIGIQHPARVMRNRSTYELNSNSDYNIFKHDLASKFEQIKQAR
jgi:hypothetical protein